MLTGMQVVDGGRFVHDGSCWVLVIFRSCSSPGTTQHPASAQPAASKASASVIGSPTMTQTGRLPRTMRQALRRTSVGDMTESAGACTK